MDKKDKLVCYWKGIVMKEQERTKDEMFKDLPCFACDGSDDECPNYVARAELLGLELGKKE